MPRISELPAVSVPNDGDEIPVNQSGTTRKMTRLQMRSGLALFTHTHALVDITDAGDLAAQSQLESAQQVGASGTADASTFLRGDLQWAVPAGTGEGETNTATNVGTNGVGVVDGKVGSDLQFRHINSLHAALTVVLDATDNDIDLDIAEATVSVAGLMSASDKTKLDGIEALATADMTDAEIVAAINTELGQTDWQIAGDVSSVFGLTGDVDITSLADASSITPSTTWLVFEDGAGVFWRESLVNLLSQITGTVTDVGGGTVPWDGSHHVRLLVFEGASTTFRLDDVTNSQRTYVWNQSGGPVAVTAGAGVNLAPGSDTSIPDDGLALAFKLDDDLAIVRVLAPANPGILSEQEVTGSLTVDDGEIGILQRYTGAGHTWTINSASSAGIVPIINEGTDAITISEGTANTSGAASIPVGASASILYSNAGANARVVSE